jgi:hypothetical protein
LRVPGRPGMWGGSPGAAHCRQQWTPEGRGSSGPVKACEGGGAAGIGSLLGSQALRGVQGVTPGGSSGHRQGAGSLGGHELGVDWERSGERELGTSSKSSG